MLDFHNPIPDLRHQECRALIAQEYWYRGELISDANVLFLRLQNDTWHRFLIDAGVVFWSTVAAPEAPEEDSGYRHPHKDIGVLYGLVGKRLSTVSTADLPGGGELRLDFDGGETLILRNIDDCSKLVFERRAKAR
jgi:hypothetical protein